MNADPPEKTDSPQLRTDVLTGCHVIVAVGRSGRPNAISLDPPLARTDDPFTEGNEPETPRERLAVRAAGSLPDQPGWQVRVVPNRYPAVTELLSEVATQDSASKWFPSQTARGLHDVVIECPDSRSRMAELSPDELTRVLKIWQQRLQQLTADGRFPFVSVFHNEGFSAGASLSHCHSQIIAAASGGPALKERIDRAERHLAEHGSDLVEELLAAERMAGSRMIHDGALFVTLCPFAPRVAWHVRIIPTAAVAGTFADVSPAHLAELAVELLRQLRNLEVEIGRFSFNLLLPTPPTNRHPAPFRWMLEILPRTSRAAGWELLTGIDIVTTSPEAAAESLRRRMTSAGS